MTKYWKNTRLAAHWILGKLITNDIVLTGERNAGETKELYHRTFLSKSLKELQDDPECKFEKHIMRDGAGMLKRNGFIEFTAQDTKNENASELKATKNGEIVFLEEAFLQQIQEENYKRNLNRSNLWTPILALVISVIALFLGLREDKKEIIVLNYREGKKIELKRDSVLITDTAIKK